MIVDVADAEHAEPVPLCHPVQAIVHVRLAPASSRQIFEKQRCQLLGVRATIRHGTRAFASM
jgi:hypothetical protein